MGRQQHLTRLALGRSAFQDVDDEGTAQIEREQDTAFQGTTSGYVQRYDSKGRPVNPGTDARNAEARRAYNSVYSIIGVVEKRETLRQASEKRALEEQCEERSTLLRAEDRCGCDIKSIAAVAEPMAVVWINNLTWRYQLGLYHHRRSFVHQIRATWFLAIQGGWQGANSALFAGAAAGQLHHLAQIASKKAMALIKGQSHKLHWTTLRKLRRLGRVLQYLEIVTLGCIDILLLPLQYWARVQQLGLAPALPLLPPLGFVLPWHPKSFHAFAWRPVLNIPLIGLLTSPAILLLLGTIARDAHTNADLPISYRSASLLYHENDPYLEVETQPVPSISFEWLLHQAYKARVSLLAWCGWDLVTTKTAGALQTSLGASATGFQALYNNQHSRDPNLDDHNYENLIVLGENHLGPQAAITYRSTALAQLPVKFLASCVDTMMFRLWTLPLDTFVLRAIAASYIAASLPMTTEAVAAAPRLSSAIQFWRPSTSSNSKSFASYASKIGLGLATQVALDLVIFGGLYGMVRFEGVRKFGWGPVRPAKDNRPFWRL
ncbi:hypothetical protein LTR10_009946 [Elasticomyces elasticus]|nr:hypothetical protein LTR10_009946 [Elasticomyces elasticus]KAK4970238.1 hypothetical protein LTR42_008405 [Elasticomyces elasticus]